MAVVRGLDVLIYAGDKAVGGSKNCSLKMESETIDASYKGAEPAGWGISIAGSKSWSCDLDGAVIVDDLGYKELVDAFMGGTEVTVAFKNGTLSPTVHFEGKAYVTSFEMGADFSDVLTYSLSLSGAGALVDKKAV